ncbi:MAG: hypothetical protein ACOYK6_07715 [Chthoniobacterales bacterium]
MNIQAFLRSCHRKLFFLTTVLFLFLLVGRTPLFAQQAFQSDAHFVAPKKKSHAIQKKVEKESLITPDGILTKAYQSKRPWEMLSPFAPESYGTGEEMISENPDQLGKQNGLIVFGIEW